MVMVICNGNFLNANKEIQYEMVTQISQTNKSWRILMYLTGGRNHSINEKGSNKEGGQYIC